jgi:3-oxoacyl-[acyl-carrier-protein] synthase-3
VTRIGLAGTASYLPERWVTAAEIGEAAGIPEDVIVGKFGLRGKHVAGVDEHVTDMCVAAGERLLAETGLDAAEIDAVVYYGSTWKEFAVWQAAPWIAARLGCVNAFALEYDNVSAGTPLALRLCRNYLVAEPDARRILAVAASRESYLVDYGNERSRFAFTFGDGAVAGLVVKDHPANELLGSHALTDGSLSLAVKVPSGGSVHPNGGYRFLDVDDPAAMKRRLDDVSLRNFVGAAAGALARSGLELEDVSYLCALHVKPSMRRALCAELGIPEERAALLDDTGHMSGVDPLLGLDRAVRRQAVAAGDVVLLLAAGTGYTWAASVVRWGPCG